MYDIFYDSCQTQSLKSIMLNYKYQLSRLQSIMSYLYNIPFACIVCPVVNENDMFDVHFVASCPQLDNPCNYKTAVWITNTTYNGFGSSRLWVQ